MNKRAQTKERSKVESKETTQTTDRNSIERNNVKREGSQTREREREKGVTRKREAKRKRMELGEKKEVKRKIGLGPSCRTTNRKDTATTLLLFCYSLCFVVQTQKDRRKKFDVAQNKIGK